MSKKASRLSPLWVKAPYGERLHRTREYTHTRGRTLCGLRVSSKWLHPQSSKRLKCKRCAA